MEYRWNKYKNVNYGEEPQQLQYLPTFQSQDHVLLTLMAPWRPASYCSLQFPIIRHGRVYTAKLKVTLSLNCGPLVNNFDFESLSVDCRFCYWYSWFKEKQTKQQNTCFIICFISANDIFICFPCQGMFLSPVFSVGVPLRLRIFDKEGMRLYNILAHSFKLKLLKHVHNSSYWLPFPLLKFHRRSVPPEVFKTGSQ